MTGSDTIEDRPFLSAFLRKSQGRGDGQARNVELVTKLLTESDEEATKTLRNYIRLNGSYKAFTAVTWLVKQADESIDWALAAEEAKSIINQVMAGETTVNFTNVRSPGMPPGKVSPSGVSPTTGWRPQQGPSQPSRATGEESADETTSASTDSRGPHGIIFSEDKTPAGKLPASPGRSGHIGRADVDRSEGYSPELLHKALYGRKPAKKPELEKGTAVYSKYTGEKVEKATK